MLLSLVIQRPRMVKAPALFIYGFLVSYGLISSQETGKREMVMKRERVTKAYPFLKSQPKWIYLVSTNQDARRVVVGDRKYSLYLLTAFQH